MQGKSGIFSSFSYIVRIFSIPVRFAGAQLLGQYMFLAGCVLRGACQFVKARVTRAVIIAVAVSVTAADGHAEPGGAPRFGLFSGIDAAASSVFGYTGGVWAFGRPIDRSGFRLKALAGYGEYAYDGSLSGAPAGFDGDVSLGELLAGYMWRPGAWTVKGYLGLQWERHDLTPDDPANSVSGTETGVKAQLELWRDIGERHWLSVNGAYGDAFGTYWAGARVGRRLGRISLGVEAAALGNEEYDSGRAGGLLRLHLGRADLTVSGGYSGDYYGNETGGYVSFGVYGRF